VGRVDPAFDAAGLAGVLAPVPHYVAGVLGVVEDLAHRAVGPRTDPTAPTAGDRLRWRVALGVEVEPVGDGLVAESFQGGVSDGLCTRSFLKEYTGDRGS